jgi:hypothetical protein
MVSKLNHTADRMTSGQKYCIYFHMTRSAA